MTARAAPPVAHRLLESLPAVYRDADDGPGGGDLRALLAAFEAVLIGTPGDPTADGLEQRIGALPGLLAPDADAAPREHDRAAQHGDVGPDTRSAAVDQATRDAVVPWLAQRWVAFTPFAHFDPPRLRRIVGGIVPLYARRGTPAYLQALLRLCFADDIGDIALQEHLAGGLRVGHATIGRDTLLGAARPFTFRLDIALKARADGFSEHALATLRAALHAVIDFAKPAHTCCELHLTLQPAAAVAAGSHH